MWVPSKSESGQPKKNANTIPEPPSISTIVVNVVSVLGFGFNIWTIIPPRNIPVAVGRIPTTPIKQNYHGEYIREFISLPVKRLAAEADFLYADSMYLGLKVA